MAAQDPVLELGQLAGHLMGGLFAPAGGAGAPDRQVGAEVEFLVWRGDTGEVAPVAETLAFLRAYGAPLEWSEGRTPKGTPCVSVPDGGRFTFEPGGQLEYSAPPFPTASGLLAHLREVLAPLAAAADEAGLLLLTLGLDPVHPPEAAPLQLDVERYRAMDAYFAALGTAGARMMRQTAAFQVSLDLGDQPFLRWTVLNRLAPYLVAIFANSPRYAGEATGHRSYRASTWCALDSSRTGILTEESAPVAGYLEFALCAPDFLRRTQDGRWLPFAGWVARGGVTVEDWEAHLSTLFPEVRPRGYFEVRSCDAVPLVWHPAPVALLAGLVYDRDALLAARELVWSSDRELLVRAGRDGLADPGVARVAVDLWDLALGGCAALGPDYISSADLAVAHEYAERYTRRGRAPADDAAAS